MSDRDPTGEMPLSTVLLDAVGRLSLRRIVGASLAAIALVAVGDYVTGQDISFSVFYLLPVLLSASKGPKVGTRIAVVSALAWFVADVTGRVDAYETVLVPVWNASVRLIVFWLVVALAGALSRSLAHEQELSRRDALSGLANSRAFFEAAEQERRRLARTGRPLSVAYIDIDDFKTVNDTFGHGVGDIVISVTGRVLADSVRDVDVVARLGGDEFAMLLPETDEAGAAIVMQRIHDRLMLEAAGREWPIGYSIGVVAFTQSPPNTDGLVSAADALMYEVKRDGKRSVRVTTATTAPASRRSTGV